MTTVQSPLSLCVGDTSQNLLDCTFGDLLRNAAAEVPDRIALVDAVADKSARRRWTYRELLEQSEKLARSLLVYFAKGDRVAIYASNSGEWILLQHAASLAGLMLVPINPAYNESELEVVLKNSEASGVFYEPQYRGRDLEAIVNKVCNKLPSIKKTYAIDTIASLIAESPANTTLPEVSTDEVLMIQFTSGTTGVPKGACLHHKGVVNMSRFVAQRAQFPEGGVWVNAMPMFHVAGSCVTRIGALNMRGTYVVVSGFEPGLMLDIIETEKGNATLIVPTMILGMLNHPDFDKYDVSSMQTIMTGAADVPPALVTRTTETFGCGLTILFGQTETNGVVSQTCVDDSLSDQTETLGRPLPQSEVCIADPETGEILPLGERGEICVRGYQNMACYYGMEEATRNTIRESGWLHTGDMGVMDERGFLKIAGRIKDVIIRGGMNIYPREIEDVLFCHPEVNQVAVVGLPDEQWGEIIAAVVLPTNPEKPPAPEDLFQYCRQHLAVHKSPVAWFFVDQYPLTPSGKIQKFQLVDWIKEGRITAEPWEKTSSRN